MTGSSGNRRSTASRVFAGIVVTVVVLAAVLTGVWYYLARELDGRVQAAIEAAAGDGVTIDCENREVFGYPFRLGLSCQSVAIEAPEPGVRATGGSLRTAAQLYDPRRIVMELAAPVGVDAPGLPPLDLFWELGQGSARFGTGGLDRLSLVFDAPVIMLRPDGADGIEWARAERFEVHSRADGADLDLALNDRSLTLTPPGLATLPPFDVEADMAVAGAAEWLRDGLPGGRIETALRGRQGVLRRLAMTLEGGGAIEISGPFSFSPQGEVTGEFQLALEDPNAIAQIASQIFPGLGAVASTVAGGLAFAGRQENGRTVVDIEVRDGRAQLGFIPLGRIPAI